MNFRNISAWSIRNPIVPIVMFIGLTLAGIVAFMQMKVQDSPDIEFPVVIASISQPGAAPSEIENQITQLVESSVRTLNGVRSISSTASEGSSTRFAASFPTASSNPSSRRRRPPATRLPISPSARPT